MPDALTRRDFLAGATAAGAAALLPAASCTPATRAAPAVHAGGGALPIVIASENGHASRDAEGRSCVELAFSMIADGADVLDALVAGVTIVENDPRETSVGYGGLPNADGVVQLDAAVMHGPTRRAGGVAALEGVRTPALVAMRVMQHTDHHLVVGADAQRFARLHGFSVEADLNTDKSRRLWREWKQRVGAVDAERIAAVGDRVGRAMVAEGLIHPVHYHGTIHCSGIGPRGETCSVTTTSGRAFKVPGRVGDSPILGAGLYAADGAGAAGSIGRGEANLYNLSSFLIVEEMRRGAHPLDAAMTALRRIRDNTLAPHLRDERGEPNFGIDFFAVDARGRHAGAGMYGGDRYVVCTEHGPQLFDCEPLLEGSAPT